MKSPFSPSLRSAMFAFAAFASLAALPVLLHAADDGAAPAVADEAPAGAFLGVVTKPLPKVIGEHLGLAPGEGLVIEMVSPDSPAAKAGLQVDDVLIKIEDQKLVLPEQLAILLDGCQPGQTRKLEVLRDGKPVQLEATLGARPAEFANRGNQRADEPAFRGRDGQAIDGLPGMLNILPRDGQIDLAQLEQQIEKMRADMQKRVEQMQLELGQGGANGQVQMNVMRFDQGRVQIGDNEGTITIESKNGKQTLTATDKDGNVVFEGPYATDEEKAAVPDGIRKRAQRFNIQDGGIRMFMENKDDGARAEAGGGMKIEIQGGHGEGQADGDARAEGGAGIIEGDVKPGDRVD